MARYKDINYHQAKLLPISFSRQILPGTFEYSLSHVIDHELDLSVFDARYNNDENGAPAYDPAVLLKIVLYAHSRGITSRTLLPRERHLHGLVGRHPAALHHHCRLRFQHARGDRAAVSGSAVGV